MPTNEARGQVRTRPLTCRCRVARKLQNFWLHWTKAWMPIRDHRAELIVLSFGADTFEKDPISHFRLRQQDYPEIAGRIEALELPVLVVMEGGYAVEDLGHNVEAFLSGFASRS